LLTSRPRFFLGAIWKAFSTDGKFGAIDGGVTAHGAAAVSSSVPAGGNVSLSIVLAWHFPDRDFTHEILGNMYADLWHDSAAVAGKITSHVT
jgi:hypothetical protein